MSQQTLKLALICLSFWAAAGQSTQEEVNNNFFWYCVAWQNTQGTDVPPNSLYNLVSLIGGPNGIEISSWAGDAAQPTLNNLMSLDPSDVSEAQWQYSVQSTLESQKLQVMTTAQIGLIIQPIAGMQVFDSDEGAPKVYDGSAWLTVTAA